jgi:hypothetical protein
VRTANIKQQYKADEYWFFMYLLAIRKKNNLQVNVMTYYNVVVGCLSSDVTSGALQVEGPTLF